MSYINEIKKVQTGYQAMGDISIDLKYPEKTGNRINTFFEIAMIELRDTDDIAYYFGEVPTKNGKKIITNHDNVFEFSDGVKKLIPMTIDEFICSCVHYGVKLNWDDTVFERHIIKAYPKVWQKLLK